MRSKRRTKARSRSWSRGSRTSKKDHHGDDEVEEQEEEHNGNCNVIEIDLKIVDINVKIIDSHLVDVSLIDIEVKAGIMMMIRELRFPLYAIKLYAIKASRYRVSDLFCSSIVIQAHRPKRGAGCAPPARASTAL